MGGGWGGCFLGVTGFPMCVCVLVNELTLARSLMPCLTLVAFTMPASTRSCFRVCAHRVW